MRSRHVSGTLFHCEAFRWNHNVCRNWRAIITVGSNRVCALRSSSRPVSSARKRGGFRWNDNVCLHWYATTLLAAIASATLEFLSSPASSAREPAAFTTPHSSLSRHATWTSVRTSIPTWGVPLQPQYLPASASDHDRGKQSLPRS